MSIAQNYTRHSPIKIKWTKENGTIKAWFNTSAAGEPTTATTPASASASGQDIGVWIHWGIESGTESTVFSTTLTYK